MKNINKMMDIALKREQTIDLDDLKFWTKEKLYTLQVNKIKMEVLRSLKGLINDNMVRSCETKILRGGK